MHILIVADQHPASLGGVQVAIRQQRRFLERLGHRVSIAAPALHRPGFVTPQADREAIINLPSRPITRDREYAVSWPSARSDRELARALAKRPPVDLVHIQGDFWGAMIGLRAARGLRVPVVHTMHNHVDAGMRAVTRVAPVAFALLRLWRSLALGRPRAPVSTRARGVWRYLAALAAEADVVTAPSQHFAEELMGRAVAERVLVTPTGVDDDAVAAVRALPRTARERPRLVWLGRMSGEKRVLELIEALAEARLDADIELYGAGLLLPRVLERIEAHGLQSRVTVRGPVPHHEALVAIRDADALVQTSVGFETQGLTPFEAAALGTPTVYCDPRIADDVSARPEWRVRDSNVTALAEALRGVVSELRAAGPDGLRVAEGASGSLFQSKRTERMLEIYDQAVSGR